jgi:enamine deaminase RidA (YjgF/YER057c/UK114 family)
MMNIFNKIEKSGLKLPPCPKPLAAYVPAIRIKDTIYVSGQLPICENTMPTGFVPSQISIPHAQKAAATCFLNALSAALSLITETEDLQLVQIQGFVQCTPDFKEIPQVINGASELAIQIMEDKGVHARTAVGVASLPKDAPVEIACVFNVLDTSTPNYSGRYEWIDSTKG